MTDIRAVPVETASQTDYMYSDWATGVTAMRPQANFTMHHALTSIQVDIVNGSYLSASKPGRVTSVSVASSQLATAASLDITTAAGDAAHGGLSAFQGSGTDIAAAAGFNISSVPHSTRILAVPMGGKADLSVRVVMDGKTYTVPVTAVPEPFRPGKNYVVTLTAKAGENPFAVTGVAVKPWTATGLGNVMASKEYKSDQYVVELDIPQYNPEYMHNMVGFTGMIDWGDGTSTTCSSTINHPSHKYASPGKYVVTATGKCDRLEGYTTPGKYMNAFITDIVHIGGGMGITSMEFAFSYANIKFLKKGILDNLTEVTNFHSTFDHCSSLQSIPAGLFDKCTQVTSFFGTFCGCTDLQSIPAGLFDHCTEVTSFQHTFKGCSFQSIPAGLFDKCTKATNFWETFAMCDILQSIPAGLFDKCTQVTNFGDTFEKCSSLQSIPAGLFDNCPLVTHFGGTFGGCASLQSIPSGLFDKCTKVTQFNGTFSWCSSLQSIPTGLFDNHTKVTSFQYTFEGCLSLKGESPYTEIVTTDGRRVNVHLYERENWPEFFTDVLDGKDCFIGCTGLSDYWLIHPP